MNKIMHKKYWTGTILIIGVVLFLLFDAIGKLLKTTLSVDATIAMGYTDATVFALGLTLLIITILYAIPKTAIIGAILLTGWLGGAVASHIISGEGWLWFPLLFGCFAWLGLWLKDKRIQNIVKLK